MRGFDPEIFNSLIGGRAVVETPRLNVKSKDEAYAFLKTYGYDLRVDSDREKLWQIHARAVVYLRTQLLKEGETLPEDIADPKQLEDVTRLLQMASAPEPTQPERHRWTCALLRVMHVVSQLHNDLFNYFSLEIQEDIFRPYRQFVQKNGEQDIQLVSKQESIGLQKFEMKPFKDSDSAITKLLAKPEEVAFGLLDKIGVRFVTGSLFDVFRVMRFLVENHVVSPANIIPSQSNNTLYPVNLFNAVMAAVPEAEGLSAEEVDRHLKDRLNKEKELARFLEKRNVFTSREYRFVKFITRQLVRVTLPDSQKSFSFFYPYEVQILDQEHYLKSLTGPASHDEYKARQRERARQRVLVQ